MVTIMKLPSGGWINLDTISGACVVKGRLLLGWSDGSESPPRTLEDEAAIIAALDAEDAKRRAAADPSPTFSAPAPDMSHDLRIDAPWRSAPPEEGPKVPCAEEHTPIVCPSCGKECVVIITANGAPVCYKCGYNTEGGE
jgi:hypothetical protein